MMDVFTRERRSQIMAAIRAKDTTPELAVRRTAHRLGYRYRLHRKHLPGKPDLVFPARRSVIFVHGCFWHQHAAQACKARPPKSKLEYWGPKLKQNVERDKKNQAKLRDMGWRILVIWECQTKDVSKLEKIIMGFLGS
ncbi:MAG: DNA mismatch endonuclease Vsr [Armatimonadetes bacterium]|nr:DNA mismatch endonuclease Vsr [Armatimonadota bacterium]